MNKKNVLNIDMLDNSNLLGAKKQVSKKEEQGKEEGTETHQALDEEKISEEKKTVTAPQQKDKNIFVDNFDDEPGNVIFDGRGEKDVKEKITKKTEEVVNLKEQLEKKEKGLDVLIENGDATEKKEGLSLKIALEEFQDQIEEVADEVEKLNIDAVKPQIKALKEVSNKNQANTTNSEKEDVVGKTVLQEEDKQNSLVEVLERLEKVIELGQKILNRLDSLIDNQNVVEKTQKVTQNTQNSIAVK